MRLVESGGCGDTYGYRIVRLGYERFLSCFMDLLGADRVFVLFFFVVVGWWICERERGGEEGGRVNFVLCMCVCFWFLWI